MGFPSTSSTDTTLFGLDPQRSTGDDDGVGVGVVQQAREANAGVRVVPAQSPRRGRRERTPGWIEGRALGLVVPGQGLDDPIGGDQAHGSFVGEYHDRAVRAQCDVVVSAEGAGQLRLLRVREAASRRRRLLGHQDLARARERDPAGAQRHGRGSGVSATRANLSKSIKDEWSMNAA
ncbi:hypothetical protein [Nannocystis pusilla]|uniref:hypothetical protein n=1 Tax=Nannocystis pusilla TaxID=889268 RepID=UPI003B7CBDFA